MSKKGDVDDELDDLVVLGGKGGKLGKGKGGKGGKGGAGKKGKGGGRPLSRGEEAGSATVAAASVQKVLGSLPRFFREGARSFVLARVQLTSILALA